MSELVIYHLAGGFLVPTLLAYAAIHWQQAKWPAPLRAAALAVIFAGIYGATLLFGFALTFAALAAKLDETERFNQPIMILAGLFGYGAGRVIAGRLAKRKAA